MLALIAVAALLQQETPEALFNRMEHSIEEAKSLRIKYRLDLEQGGQTATGTGIVLLKQGNKAKITLTGAKGNPWAVSDGKKLTVDANQALIEGAELDTPKDLNLRVATKLARWGVLDLPSFPRVIRTYGVDPKERLKVSDIKFGEKDGDVRTLTYVVQEGNGKVELKLWVDPKDLTLKKRTLSVGNLKATVTETYEEFTVNGEIPDESFKP